MSKNIVEFIPVAPHSPYDVLTALRSGKYVAKIRPSPRGRIIYQLANLPYLPSDESRNNIKFVLTHNSDLSYDEFSELQFLPCFDKIQFCVDDKWAIVEIKQVANNQLDTNEDHKIVEFISSVSEDICDLLTDISSATSKISNHKLHNKITKKLSKLSSRARVFTNQMGVVLENIDSEDAEAEVELK